jgi:hypothetical protein
VSGLFHALPRLIAPLLVASASVAHAADPITTRTDEVGKLLNEWAAKGTAAGLSRLTYENRDDAHSALPTHLWPGLNVHAFTEQEPSWPNSTCRTNSLFTPSIKTTTPAAMASAVGAICFP